MRESSVTLPSASGTLKSTRTKTRLPAASRSRMVSLSIFDSSGSPGGSGSGQPVGDELHEVRDAAAVAPLVVVPGDDLDEVAAQDHVRREVDDRRPAVASEVAGDERLVAGAEDALERAGGRVAEGLVELLEGDVLLELRGEVHDRHRRGGDAEAEAVELALEVRDDEGEGLRGAGGGRDDVEGGGAKAARVLVGDVQDALVVGVAVDRVHQAAPDRPPVVDDLGGRGKAVRGAGGVADDVVLRRVVGALV